MAPAAKQEASISLSAPDLITSCSLLESTVRCALTTGYWFYFSLHDTSFLPGGSRVLNDVFILITEKRVCAVSEQEVLV